MNQWEKFYKARINSTYQTYFEKRYKEFLDLITGSFPKTTIEEGIGIGSVSKYLLNNTEVVCYGYDISEEILDLTRQNLGGRAFLWKDNILQPSIPQKSCDIAVTHGVLEHFSDLQILSIFERYKVNKVPNIHYMPLDKYHKPSFGDERLMPYIYWLDLIKPKDYLLINDKHDLILINL